MQKYKIPAVILVVLTVLLYIHLGGLFEYWYVKYQYLDILNHFLGGFSIALTTYWLGKNPKWIIPSAIIFGLIWEVFEYHYDLTSWPTDDIRYWLDSLKDMVMDTIGAVAIWVYFKFKK